MQTRQFQAESRRLLDLMINSIYTHKEIFLRELISNASDAIDKNYYRILTSENVTFDKNDFYINIAIDKDARTLTIEDTGIGMNMEIDFWVKMEVNCEHMFAKLVSSSCK